MKKTAIFSVGDYEFTASFATIQRGGGGQAYYFPGMKKDRFPPPDPRPIVKPNPPFDPSKAGKPVNPVNKTIDPLPKGISSPRIPKETGLVHVAGKGKTYVETGGKGFRKAHIKNIRGKAVMVGQSILKAGKNTASRLSLSAGKPAGMIGGTVLGVGAIGGGIYGGVVLGRKVGNKIRRKKRERR